MLKQRWRQRLFSCLLWLLLLEIASLNIFIVRVSGSLLSSSSKDYSRYEAAKLDGKSFETVKNMHMNWYINAMKALMGQLAKELVTKLQSSERKRLLVCLNHIDDKADLVGGARCLIKARRLAEKRHMRSQQIVKNEEAPELRIDEVLPVDVGRISENSSQPEPELEPELRPEQPPKELEQSETLFGQVLGFMKKWFVIPTTKNAVLETQSAQHVRSSLGNVTTRRGFVDTTGGSQRRVQSSPPQRRVLRFNSSSSGHVLLQHKIHSLHSPKMRSLPQKFRLAQQLRRRLAWRRDRAKRSASQANSFGGPWGTEPDRFKQSNKKAFKITSMNAMPSLLDTNSKSVARRVSNLLRTAVNGNRTVVNGDWSKAYNRLLELRSAIEQRKKLPGARVYERRLYDIVIDSSHPTMSSKKRKNIPDVLVSAYSLIDSLSGKSAEERSTMNLKMLSPRFAPLMPDKMESRSRHLSPSFFSFYKDNESSDNIASIPKLLEDGGVPPQDHDAIIEAVMDVSGAKDAVNMGIDILSTMNFTGLKGDIIEVTNRLDQAFKQLQSSFNHEQNGDIDKNGFAFLEPSQLRELIDSHGVHKPEEVGFDMDEYARLTKAERLRSLWRNVEQVARNEPTAFTQGPQRESTSANANATERSRSKRQISVLAPLVLAPFVFSPMSGLSILGPVVLSPSIFSVLLLDVSVLGPYVLSPAFFLPFIVSPYLLSPYVLSPIFGAPFILNPYVLSPNVINPYVLSPLILSPYVLCPDVYSPQALGGAILSPSAWSPAFMTESLLMASVLSPTFMS